MANKVLLAYVVIDFILVAHGALILGLSLHGQSLYTASPTNGKEAITNFIWGLFPLTAGILNAMFTFLIFLISLLGLTAPGRKLLKVSGYLTAGNAVYKLVLGLYLWTLTLKSKNDLSVFWSNTTPEVQSLMQTSFGCCGFFNSTSPAFVTDSTCISPASAALFRGCATPLASFGNGFVNTLFTAMFGMVGFDFTFILATACLSKHRKEQARFHSIDKKTADTF